MTQIETPETLPAIEVSEKFLTKAQQATIRVLDGGVLPHSTNERDHAEVLMNPAYRLSGGRGYAERIAMLNKRPIIIDKGPAVTLQESAGFESQYIKDLRQRAEQEQHDGIISTVADHMMNYVEEAAHVIDDVTFFEESIENLDDSQPLGPLFLDLQPESRRALAAVARLVETMQYATQSEGHKSRMNADLTIDSPENLQRIFDTVGQLNVGEIRRQTAELLSLEYGRLEFWFEQVLGRPDRPDARERHGIVETKNLDIRNTILERMSAIAASGWLNDSEK